MVLVRHTYAPENINFGMYTSHYGNLCRKLEK